MLNYIKTIEEKTLLQKTQYNFTGPESPMINSYCQGRCNKLDEWKPLKQIDVFRYHSSHSQNNSMLCIDAITMEDNFHQIEGSTENDRVKSPRLRKKR